VDSPWDQDCGSTALPYQSSWHLPKKRSSIMASQPTLPNIPSEKLGFNKGLLKGKPMAAKPLS